jgi:signal transduction histidine kinase
MIKSIFTFFFLFLLTSIFAQTKIDSTDYYLEKKELIKGLNYAKTKSNYFFEHNQFDKFCRISVKKAKIYGRLNDHDKALSTLFKALAVSNKNKLKGSTEIIEQIGTRYSIIRDSTKAFKNYYKALNIGLKERDTSNLIYVYHNLFRLYSEKNLDSSYKYMVKKYDLDKRSKSILGISHSYINYFAYYTHIKKPEFAKIYLDSAYNYSIQHKIIVTQIASLSNMAYYYMETKKDFKKALAIYDKLLIDYKKEFVTLDYVDIYINLVYANEQLGDYKKANHYFSLLREYEEKLYNEKINDKAREIETKYAIDIVENEFNEKSKYLIKKENKNKSIFLIFLALFGFSLVLFYIFYQNLQLKQRNKIKELDSEIQENIITASIDGQELERKKLAEVLHDNISALLSSASLHLSAFLVGKDSHQPEEILKAKSLLKEAHDKVRDLSHELVPPVLAKLGLYHAINDLCEKNSNSIIYFTFNSSNSHEKCYNEEFETKVYFIITELINNILKHSKATIGNITLEEQNNQLIINIEDNGNGFDSTKTQADGFGLTQIKARVKSLKGRITISSKIDTGTLIYIKLQIPQR